MLIRSEGHSGEFSFNMEAIHGVVVGMMGGNFLTNQKVGILRKITET